MQSMMQWMEHFKNWDTVRPICVHAEDETLAAVLYVHSMFSDKKLHVCHVSSKTEIELVKAHKQRFNTITCEVAPHHLFLTKDQFNETPNLGEVKPPLHDDSDCKALWDNMEFIDCFATDHAPHARGEKECSKCPGFPGLETALVLLLDAVNRGMLTIDDIILRYHTNPRKIFNLPEQPNTFIEVDMDCEHTISSKPRFSKCDWTPFGGTKVKGSIKRVVLRGKTVYIGDVPTITTKERGRFVSTSVQHQTQSSQPSLSFVAVPNVTLPSEILRTTTINHSSFLSVDGLTKDSLRTIFRLADEFAGGTSNGNNPNRQSLSGKTIGLCFFEPSTRTRCSFEVAAKKLGANVVALSPSESSLQKGETLEDTIRCLSAMCDGLVVRHNQPDSMPRVMKSLGTKKSIAKVINAGDGSNEHPTQTLIDLYTIRQEIGTLGGLTVVMVGDLKNGRTVHSLAKALSLRSNVILHYVSPKGLSMPPSICEYVAKRGVEQHHHSVLSPDIVAVADVLYMTRLQKERLTMKESQELGGEYTDEFCITPAVLSVAKPTMRVLHPLPRGPEISVDIDSDARAAYHRQMDNSVPVRMALLHIMFSNQ
jgi:carbamoyl-phosphate synthase/aspartate carbamoyltransferase/dihydroorotase